MWGAGQLRLNQFSLWCSPRIQPFSQSLFLDPQGIACKDFRPFGKLRVTRLQVRVDSETPGAIALMWGALRLSFIAANANLPPI